MLWRRLQAAMVSGNTETNGQKKGRNDSQLPAGPGSRQVTQSILPGSVLLSDVQGVLLRNIGERRQILF